MPNFTQEQLEKITTDIFEAGGVPSTAPGFDEILVPGEIEARQTERRLREGIPIDDETWRQIQETAAEVGIPELEF